MAAYNQVDILTLGAFGCGAFANDPAVVAGAFTDALLRYRNYFDVVEFAIFCRDHETENYQAFMEQFGYCLNEDGIGTIPYDYPPVTGGASNFDFDYCSFYGVNNETRIEAGFEPIYEKGRMSRIQIVKKGITKLDVDVIVNAANEGLQEGGGVCGAIFREAGSEKLQKACNQYGHCKTGSAVITEAFDLKQKYIIHAVGPVWSGGNDKEEKKLRGAYKRSLELAKENRCESIAFPLISSGIFGYPKDQAWRVALETCFEYLYKNRLDYYGMDIYFAVLDDAVFEMGQKELEIQQAKYDERIEEANSWPTITEETDEEADKDFVFFWMDNEENGCFSQWYPAKMEIDGVVYSNCEQYMMAKKALAMGDIESYVLIMHETDPGEIKKLGRGVRDFDHKKWDSWKEKIIYDGNYAKFFQNDELAEKLLQTGEAILAEASPYDKIYGIGLAADDPRAKDMKQWMGQNLMGVTLMEIRKELLKVYGY